MKTFSSFGIKTESQSYTGEKKKIEWILNKEITVYAYKIVPSKYTGQRLDIQIGIGDEKYVTWSASEVLMDMIKQVPPEDFPFTTTIEKKNRHFEFT